jgi:hypothetical protein
VAQNTGAIRAVIIGEAELKTHSLYDFIGGIVHACHPRLAGIIVRFARFAQFTVIGWGVALEAPGFERIRSITYVASIDITGFLSDGMTIPACWVF